MGKPRVSIITPSYNQAAYLEQTLQSVLNQGYSNLEYIVIDGGSTDGSQEIIRRYEKYLTYWVSERDRGQADGINKGFRRATGDIVAWINSDDYYLSGALVSAAHALCENQQWGMVFGDVLSVDGSGQPINVMHYDHWGLEDLMAFNIIGQPAVFMRRSVLEQAGGLDLDYHFLLDHHLWLRMAQVAPIGYMPQIWAAGRFHPAAKNKANAAQFGREAYRLVEWMQLQPGLQTPFSQNRRKILGGARWIDAYYLSEGELYRPALKAYLKSFLRTPVRVLRDWRRLAFTVMALAAPQQAQRLYDRLRYRRKPLSYDVPRFQPGMPGAQEKGNSQPLKDEDCSA